MPEGVVKVTIDPETLQLATPECPVTREEVYIHGTEPTEFCPLHGGHMASDTAPGSWLSQVFGGDKPKGTDAAACAGAGKRVRESFRAHRPPLRITRQQQDDNKKGVLRRIFGIFGGKKDADKSQSGSTRSAALKRRRSGAFAMKCKPPYWIFLGLFPFAAICPLSAKHLARDPAREALPAQSGGVVSTTLSPKDLLEERAKVQMAEKRYEAAIQTYQDILKNESQGRRAP